MSVFSESFLENLECKIHEVLLDNGIENETVDVRETEHQSFTVNFQNKGLDFIYKGGVLITQSSNGLNTPVVLNVNINSEHVLSDEIDVTALFFYIVYQSY